MIYWKSQNWWAIWIFELWLKLFWTIRRKENWGDFERRVSLLFIHLYLLFLSLSILKQWCKYILQRLLIINNNTDMAKWFEQNSWQIEKKALHKTRNSVVNNIALEMEGKKKKRNCYNTGYSCLVLREPRRTGLTFLSERDVVLSLSRYNSLRWIFFWFLKSLKR